MNIITEQLANKLPNDSKLKKYNIVNPNNFIELYKLLKSNKIDEIHVIDSTSSKKKESLHNIITIQTGGWNR